jgi:FkbM family methyltransferase
MATATTHIWSNPSACHSVFGSFTWQPVHEDAVFIIDALGGRTRKRYYAGFDWAGSRPDAVGLFDLFRPGPNEELFEWIDVLGAVALAHGQFTMVELGCGFARWLVTASVALRQRDVGRVRLIGIEAEPTHFRWARRHLRDNGVDPRCVELIPAAVSVHEGTASFYTGSADAWYGQALTQAHLAPTPWFLRVFRRLCGSRPCVMDTVSRVRTVSLNSILDRCDMVDLIDMDIQGAELDVLSRAMDSLDRRVCRIHIGTHAPEIERGLRGLFQQLGWINRNDYPCQRENDTPWGHMHFVDGVQTWLNPKLVGDDRANA